MKTMLGIIKSLECSSVLIFNIICSAKMVVLFAKFGSGTAARNEWIRLYGNVKVPDRRTFDRNYEKFQKTSCMHNQVCILS